MQNSGLKLPPPKTSTILSHRHYTKVCLVGLFSYLILHIAIGLNFWFSEHPICPHKAEHAPWTRDISLIVSGVFICAVGLQINRMCLSTFREENDIGTISAYIASLVVNIIAANSHTTTLVWDWGGTCEDAFGVRTSAGHWPEWLIGVPLLIFIVLSVDDKPMLSKTDIFIISSLFVCILCGILLQTTKSVYLSYFYYITGFLFCMPCFYMIYTTRQELYLLLQKSANQSCKGTYQRKILLASRKATLAFGLGVLLPFFGVIYLCCILGIFSNDQAYIAFNSLSAFTKIYFASLCMDAHLEVSHPAIGLIDKEKFSNASRRAFLRYVFHEIRVPLNSLSLGLQVLSDSSLVHTDISEGEKETIVMMKDATTFMSEILNDVMALQRIEEGSLELVRSPFSLMDLFQSVEGSFADLSIELKVKLTTIIDHVPDKLIGDKFRIGHVLANLVSNALKFSNPQGKVILSVCEATDSNDATGIDKNIDADDPNVKNIKKKYLENDTILLKFSVIDEGKGISEEDQLDDIFTPFRHLKHGELQRNHRGSGLGLAICRELVHMHGGKIYYNSKLGKGSTFNVIVPFQIYMGSKKLFSPRKRIVLGNKMLNFHSHLHIVDTPADSPFSPRSQSILVSPVSMPNSPRQGEDEMCFSSSSTHRNPPTPSGHSLPPFSPHDESHDPIFQLLSSSDEDIHIRQPIAFQYSLDDGMEEGVESNTPLSDPIPPPHPSSPSHTAHSSSMHAPSSTPPTVNPHSNPPKSISKTPHVSLDSSAHSDADNLGLASPQILSRVPSSTTVDELDGSGDKPKLQALVVDDVQSNRKLLALLLMKKGMLVSYAEDGQQCLDIMSKQGVDYFQIVFMDNTMPIMTGIEATARLRSMGYNKLILGVTGNAMAEELEDFLLSGADIVMAKPMKIQLLDQLLVLIEQKGCNSQSGMKLISSDSEMKWVKRKET